MPTPSAPRIIFAQNAREDLHTLVRAHTTPQAFAFRARLVLRAAAADQPTNLYIGRAWGCSNLTVGKWRRRSLEQGVPGLQEARRSGRPQAIAAPTRVHVISGARALPQDPERTVTRWTWDELVATVLDKQPMDALSRSSIWRILHDIDLKPPQREYGLNSHDADFDRKAQAICHLYATALEAYQHGRLVLCGDEKTGRQILERNAPTKPAQAGRRERREHEYIRYGTRVLLNSLAVATGHIAWSIGPTRTATDFVAHLQQGDQRFPRMERYDWIMDNRNTPWSRAVCRVVARWCGLPFAPRTLKTGAQRRAFLGDPSHCHVFHCTPQHGSWLHQAEGFFGVVHRRC